jgi:hypothetical protein
MNLAKFFVLPPFNLAKAKRKEIKFLKVIIKISIN